MVVGSSTLVRCAAPAPLAVPYPHAVETAPRPDVSDLHLAAELTSVRRSRHWIAQWADARGLLEDTVDLLELLVSELVTNSVKYGPPDGPIVLRARRDGDVVRVSVSDGSRLLPVLCRPSETSLGGRGIALVEDLAHGWGVETMPGHGKSVWFRLVL